MDRWTPVLYFYLFEDRVSSESWPLNWTHNREWPWHVLPKCWDCKVWAIAPSLCGVRDGTWGFLHAKQAPKQLSKSFVLSPRFFNEHMLFQSHIWQWLPPKGSFLMGGTGVLCLCLQKGKRLLSMVLGLWWQDTGHSSAGAERNGSGPSGKTNTCWCFLGSRTWTILSRVLCSLLGHHLWMLSLVPWYSLRT